MAHERFVNIDRETPMLLPPDLRDWVPEDDLAHFILDTLAHLDLSRASVNQRHSGSAQYPPAMMLAVLVYSYATGTFSSRQIEALTYQHLCVRYLAANHHPDHDTICKFRRENGRLLHDAFAHVLRTARELGVAQVGTVCLDGTKLHAQAAKRRTLNQEELKAAEAKLDLQISELLREAEKADAQTNAPGTQLPEHLRGHQRRREQIRLAQELLAAQTKERAAARETERTAWKKTPWAIAPKRVQPSRPRAIGSI
jgi:transposase